MANRKVTDLPEKTVLDSDDYVYLVDREDTTESAQGTSKKAKISAVSAMSENYTNTRADQARDEAKIYADSIVVGLWDDRGNYDASSNVFPSTGGSGTAGAILRGDTWTISVNGTLGSKPVNVGDVIRALTDNPMQNSGNWNILELNFGYIAENTANKQNSMTADGSGVKFPTVDAVNGALTSKQNTLVSGTNIKTVNGNSLLGSGNLQIPKTYLINLGFATTNLAASTGWYVPTRESSNLFQNVMVVDGTYNNTTRILGDGRTAGAVLPFDCRIKSIVWSSGSIGTPLTLNIHAWTPSSSSSSNNHTVGSKVITATTGGETFPYTGSEIDTTTVLPKHSRIAPFLFNNNVASGTLRFNLFAIEIEEVI